MHLRSLLLCLIFAVLSLPVSGIERKQAIIDLSQQKSLTAGEYANFFQESSAPLTLEQAIERFDNSPMNMGSGQSLSLGISVSPVWLKVRLLLPENEDPLYRFSVETPWLDYIDAWLVHNGKIIKQVRGGDALAYSDRPMQYRYFAFESPLPEGETTLYMRVETVGPMAIPLYISEAKLATQRDVSSGYQYGFLYGIMVALAVYNLIIYFSIRHKEYGLYALYLLGFVANSLSYTGQLHTWITPDWGAYFQDWMDIFLMITYSIAGLHFARVLLNTRFYAPLLDKVTTAVTVVIPIGMIISAAFNQLTIALLLAFILNSSFAILFIVLGQQALKHNVPAARLFLICSVTAATCICISTAAVWGLVPYNDFTFKLIELGVAFEAIFLAFLLAQRFRLAEIEKQLAVRTARQDALTGLNNRTGFEHLVHPMWHQHVRRKRDVSLILIDIDHFKKINDQYGHAIGDEVLRCVAALLEHGSRRGDIIARWGGEEFLLFLPDTSEEQANQHAERLRILIEDAVIDSGEANIQFTASFGVCGTKEGLLADTKLTEDVLEHMINVADKALYDVKQSGRNSVRVANC
jgi:diguanylate cyclase (GGDEF)-like protein